MHTLTFGPEGFVGQLGFRTECPCRRGEAVLGGYRLGAGLVSLGAGRLVGDQLVLVAVHLVACAATDSSDWGLDRGQLDLGQGSTLVEGFD